MTSNPTARERFEKLKKFGLKYNDDIEGELFLISLVEAAIAVAAIHFESSEDYQAVLDKVWTRVDQRMAEGEGK